LCTFQVCPGRIFRLAPLAAEAPSVAGDMIGSACPVGGRADGRWQAGEDEGARGHGYQQSR
jgi:hypothetical protein